MAAQPTHAVVQLEYRNAFNLVSRTAAAAVLSAALPASTPVAVLSTTTLVRRSAEVTS